MRVDASEEEDSGSVSKAGCCWEWLLMGDYIYLFLGQPTYLSALANAHQNAVPPGNLYV
jgi:hypothetical protein